MKVEVTVGVDGALPYIIMSKAESGVAYFIESEPAEAALMRSQVYRLVKFPDSENPRSLCPVFSSSLPAA